MAFNSRQENKNVLRTFSGTNANANANANARQENLPMNQPFHPNKPTQVQVYALTLPLVTMSLTPLISPFCY